MAFTDNIESAFETIGKDNLSEVRKTALENFKTLGIPSARHEEWKYTNIKTKLKENLKLVASAESQVAGKAKINVFKAIEGTKLVFINGYFSPAQSTITPQSGVVSGSLKELRSQYTEVFAKYFNKATDSTTENFAALNTAFAQDGAFIYIQKNIKATQPIFIINVYDAASSDVFTQTRNLIVAEDGAEVNIVEDFQNTGGEKTYNHVAEIFIGKNAEVNYTYLQIENKQTTSINSIEAKLEKDARYHISTLTFEGQTVRNNVNAYMEGENAIATLNGLYLGKETAHIDSHILVDHRVPHCDSHQVYKGVLDDESTGVFNGKIFVRKDAQKTNAFQSSKAILLSEDASVNSKPQLEIFADDVKCSHGAAIGQINKNELFYLRARGIDEATARGILTYAYGSSIIDAITLPELKDYLYTKLKERLNIAF
ncbi:MAG: Iron-regulated transporter permease protein SufD [Bacteroidetes bacterium]|nr:Iron-regulated transporter permease protein SufD [Bacteroidota bacterium]